MTGSSSGIGAATAKALASEGAQVILVARNEDKLSQVVKEITASGGKATYYVCDLTDALAIETMAARIKVEMGTPQILVNNAGSGRWKFTQETSAEEAMQMMQVPYFAAFNLTRAFLPEMLKNDSGHIVNISSVSSRFVWPGATAYHAARWAVKGFTEALRSDLYKTNIGVTLYESGVVESDYWQNNPGSRERLPRIAKMIPNLKPEQAATAIVRGIQKNKRSVVLPFMMRAIYIQHFFFPRVVQWLMTVTGYQCQK